jgi:hypothetical protein
MLSVSPCFSSLELKAGFDGVLRISPYKDGEFSWFTAPKIILFIS